jgi:hypothetical protein
MIHGYPADIAWLEYPSSHHPRGDNLPTARIDALSDQAPYLLNGLRAVADPAAVNLDWYLFHVSDSHDPVAVGPHERATERMVLFHHATQGGPIAINIDFTAKIKC